MNSKVKQTIASLLPPMGNYSMPRKVQNGRQTECFHSYTHLSTSSLETNCRAAHSTAKCPIEREILNAINEFVCNARRKY